MTDTHTHSRPGKYGKRPPKRHPAIPFGRIWSGTVPSHPVATDYLISRPGWKMLGNGPDPENQANGVPAGGAGDCVAAWWSNGRRLVTSALGGGERYPPLAQVVEVYKTQNAGFPAQDDGMDIQTLLEYLVAHGGPDGVKAVAFAKVDHTQPEQVKAAIAIFGSVCLGLQVIEANEVEFDQGQPWDYVAGSPDVGGHCILVGGYGAEPPGAAPVLGGDEKAVTWAEEISLTDRGWSRLVDECWVVIWPEHLGSGAFAAGVDQQALAQAYTQITGRAPTWPVPAPTPPGPLPAPVVDDGSDEAFARVLLAANVAGQPWVDQRHSGYVSTVAHQGRAWLGARFPGSVQASFGEDFPS